MRFRGQIRWFRINFWDRASDASYFGGNFKVSPSENFVKVKLFSKFESKLTKFEVKLTKFEVKLTKFDVKLSKCDVKFTTFEVKLRKF